MKTGDQTPLVTTPPLIVSVQTVFILTTLMLIGSGSAGLGVYALQAWYFHFQNNVPVREQPHYNEFLVLLPLAVSAAVLLGKYLWLSLLMPFASRADVAPWIAYGAPRRLHPFDDAFLKRFYKR